MADEMLLNIQGYNPNLNSWQDETNADKFGKVDSIALEYTRSGLESLTFPKGENLTGQNFDSAVFLSGEQMFARQVDIDGYFDYQTSFPLSEAVKSTGR